MTTKNRISRRDWLRLSSMGALGVSASGWLRQVADAAGTEQKRKKSCILLWMPGGPSQIDTFDPKPGEATGGTFKAIETIVPGIRIGEHLPKVASQMKHLAVIRSMSTKEGDHARAAYLLRTGNLPMEPLQYPSVGALFSKELGDSAAAIPNFVSIGARRGVSDGGFGSGYLGPDYAPLLVGSTEEDAFNQGPGVDGLRVPDLASMVKSGRTKDRATLLAEMNRDFASGHDGVASRSVRAAYERAVKLMNSDAAKAFSLEDEPAKLREAYGHNLFGQGCLLARRLVERGVPFIEVSLGRIPGVFGGWDSHARNFDAVKSLCGVLDPAWGTLMTDLRERGLLDSTMVVWMGEFGRTPRINGNAGRDHFPNAWSAVLGGGGIKGGLVHGKTSKDGNTVEDKAMNVPDLLATICKGLGVDSSKQNISNIGRPIRIVDKSAKPALEVLS